MLTTRAERRKRTRQCGSDDLASGHRGGAHATQSRDDNWRSRMTEKVDASLRPMTRSTTMMRSSALRRPISNVGVTSTSSALAISRSRATFIGPSPLRHAEKSSGLSRSVFAQEQAGIVQHNLIAIHQIVHVPE